MRFSDVIVTKIRVCIVFLYKVISATTSLTCIIQHFKLFSRICVNVDRFDNIAICTQKKKKAKLLCKYTPN